MTGPDHGPVSPMPCTIVIGAGQGQLAATHIIVPTPHDPPVVTFTVIHTVTLMKVSLSFTIHDIARNSS